MSTRNPRAAIHLTTRRRIGRARVSLENALGRVADGRSVPVDVVITDDAHMSRLSARFLGKRHPTDVLAFAYGRDPLRRNIVCGEVYISVDTARRQAGERGVPLKDELLLLAVHGLLHLSGERDETYSDWCSMKRAEFETMIRLL